MNLSDEASKLMETFNPNFKSRLQTLENTCPRLSEILIKLLYEDSYQNQTISLKERQIATIATVASISAEAQLKFQGLAAFRIGITKAEIEEVLLQVGIFAGFSRAMNASLILDDVFKKFERGEWDV